MLPPSIRLRCSQGGYSLQRTIVLRQAFKQHIHTTTSGTRDTKTVKLDPAKSSFQPSSQYVAHRKPQTPGIQQMKNVGPLGWGEMYSTPQKQNTWRDGLAAVWKAIGQYLQQIGNNRLPVVVAPGAKKNHMGETIGQEKSRIITKFSTKRQLPSTNRHVKRLRDCIEALKPYVNRKHLVNFSIHVYDSEGTSAQAVRTQSGLVRVMFHRKCIENCTTNSQLAHIAAHEISHLILRHAEQYHGHTYEENEPLRLQHEFEADHLGLIMMARAGYDEKGSVQWLKREISKDIHRHKRNPPKPILPGHKTHPSLEERIEKLEALFPQAQSERVEWEPVRKQEAQWAEQAARARQAADRIKIEEQRQAEAKEVEQAAAKEKARLRAERERDLSKRKPVTTSKPPEWLKNALKSNSE